MKVKILLILILLNSFLVSAYYSQLGDYEVRTRIDKYGQAPTSLGGIKTDYTAGGMHPVTANFTAPYSGYLGAWDLDRVPPPRRRAGGGGSGGGGGGAPILKVIVMKEDSLTAVVKPGIKIIFGIDNQQHGIMINAISSILFTIDGAYQYLLELDQEQAYDVTEDGVADISMKLQSVSNNEALITIKKLAQTRQSGFFNMPEFKEPEIQKPVSKTKKADIEKKPLISPDASDLPTKRVRKTKFNYYSLAALILLALALIVLLGFIFKKRGHGIKLYGQKSKSESVDVSVNKYKNEIEELKRKYGLK
jgi:hypothetical protein